MSEWVDENGNNLTHLVGKEYHDPEGNAYRVINGDHPLSPTRFVRVKKLKTGKVFSTNANSIMWRLLTEHIIAMEGDPYLEGHPEWVEIVREAREVLRG